MALAENRSGRCLAVSSASTSNRDRTARSIRELVASMMFPFLVDHPRASRYIPGLLIIR